MRVTLVGWAYDGDLADERALLARYETLTGWGEALLGSGVAHVHVVHRFHRNARVVRGGVHYDFVDDGAGPRPANWVPPTAVAAAVATTGADVVHVNGLGFPLQTWWLRRHVSRACALVVQDHADGPPPGQGGIAALVRGRVRRVVMRAPDAYFFTSREQAGPWQASGAIDPFARVVAILEGSTRLAPRRRDDARAATGVAGAPAVLWVGRLNANKDPLCVIEGFARASARLPEAMLTMVYGSNELGRAVQARLDRDASLRGRVRLVGAVAHEAIADFCSAADLFVLGSHHEGSGYALIEACACGATPVVSDIPAFRALTGGGAVGRLWRAGDPDACADALLAAASESRETARARVRAHFEDSLSWTAVGRQAREAYEAIVHDRRARRTRRAG